MTGRFPYDRVAPPAPGEPPVMVALTPELASEAADVAGEACYLLNHAANVFGLLRDGLAGGAFSTNDPGVTSLAELCERAFRDMAWIEGEVLDKVGTAIRHAVGARAEERRATDLARQAEEARRAAHD